MLWITLFLNLLTAAPKLAYGYFTQSLSMVADGFHSLLDSSSNLVGLLALTWMASSKELLRSDGYRKVEAVAALAIAGLLFLSCYEIFSHAYTRYLGGSSTYVTVWSFFIMMFSMVVNFWVSRYEHRRAHELHSKILEADSVHSRSDVLASASVIVSLIGVHFRLPWADLIVAAVISLFIAYSAYKILVENFRVLIAKSDDE